ncbi:outer membrane protein assembly factor BamE [Enterobacter sp. RHBSTW-00994]|uniref:OmpA family protein n=1 Tax=Enterobacter sp. RHBSTW-00994 TaxID=2742676 RepID=UPI0015EA774A|nr:OmpA family protein [Enterobacter sp. RHBSTW-00994]QLR45222.1 outer membrane protein assembly factor BamE [Enterobacter sp. RHBSTW-00994]
MNYSKYTRLALLVGGLALLSGCTRSISNVTSEGKTNAPVFPDKSDAVRAEGSFVNVDNLKQMRHGLTKAQVYELIGVPHFDEGVLHVKEWDYIFNFTMADKSVRTCQYKVLFDSDMKAQSFFFLPENCLTPQATIKPAAVAPVTASPAPVHKELSAESLFAFGSAKLSADGVAQVNQLANELSDDVLSGNQLIVTAYTDRIGKPASNLALSQARAESVKTLLVENGIPASHIITKGMGDAMPRVNCPGKTSPAVIECLAPNRRMTLDIVADRSGK